MAQKGRTDMKRTLCALLCCLLIATPVLVMAISHFDGPAAVGQAFHSAGGTAENTLAGPAKAAELTLKWAAVKGAQTYSISRSTQPNGQYEYIATVTTTTFTDRQVTSGVTYYYRINPMDNQKSLGKFAYLTLTAPAAKPAATAEPQYPLAFGAKAYAAVPAKPEIDPQMTNISSTQTVDAFTLTFYCQNAGRQPVKYLFSGKYYTQHSYPLTLAPGQSVFTGKTTLGYYQENIRYINAAITSIHTTDGTLYEIPQQEWVFYYWEVQP